MTPEDRATLVAPYKDATVSILFVGEPLIGRAIGYIPNGSGTNLLIKAITGDRGVKINLEQLFKHLPELILFDATEFDTTSLYYVVELGFDEINFVGISKKEIKELIKRLEL